MREGEEERKSGSEGREMGREVRAQRGGDGEGVEERQEESGGAGWMVSEEKWRNH